MTYVEEIVWDDDSLVAVLRELASDMHDMNEGMLAEMEATA